MFWYLVVKVSVDGEFGLDLPLEEGVVQLLVVDVDLAHLGSNLLPHFGFHGFGVLLWSERGKKINEKDGSKFHSSVWIMSKRQGGHPPSPAGPPSSPGSPSSWWTRAAQTEASLYLSCPAGISFWSTSGGAPAPCSWWPSGEPAAWAPGLSHHASPPHLDEPPAGETETGDTKLLIVLKVFLSNIAHLSLIYLFEFSHSQPVHPPQLLLWEFRYIWSDFLYNKRKSFTCKQRGFSLFCFAFRMDGRVQTSSLSSLSFLSSSNPFFRGAAVSCFSAFSGSFSFSFFTSSVS